MLQEYITILKALTPTCANAKGLQDFIKTLEKTAKINPINGKVKIQILIDKSSLEVFGNGGEKVISTMIFPDEKATGITVFSEGGKSTLSSLKIWDLNRE